MRIRSLIGLIAIALPGALTAQSSLSLAAGVAYRDVRDYPDPVKRAGWQAGVELQSSSSPVSSFSFEFRYSRFGETRIEIPALSGTVERVPQRSRIAGALATWEPGRGNSDLSVVQLAIGGIRYFGQAHSGPYAGGGLGLAWFAAYQQGQTRPVVSARLGYASRIARARVFADASLSWMGVAFQMQHGPAAESPRWIGVPLRAGISIP
jgi:hypothetical protein